ncbi:MAG: COX15/CtaA family protein [Pseudomonadales bacterium]|nr:COX15/CtaA family protein [Pseudomonadales bacterium]
MDSRKKRLILLVNFGILLGFVVVVLGAFTRLADAGLGCPDWPGCYGFFSVPESIAEIAEAEKRFPNALVESEKAWPEMIHRYFAGCLGLLILSIAWLSFRFSKLDSTFNRSNTAKLSYILLLLVICQAAFGMWTVTLKLWPQIVTVHLLGGFMTLVVLWLIRLKLVASGIEAETVARTHVLSKNFGLKVHARLGLAVLLLQIALGGWTTSNYAALACPDFPTCQNEMWPKMDIVQGFNVLQTLGPNYLGGLMSSHARIAIHVMHRVGAMVTFIVILTLGVRMLMFGRQAGVNRFAVVVMLVLLVVQLSLGVANVLFSVPLTVATMHNGVGVLLLLAVVSVNSRYVPTNQFGFPGRGGAA